VLTEQRLQQFPGNKDAGEMAPETLTFSGIALYDPAFFTACALGKRPLKPLLDQAIAEDRLTGQYFSGVWNDVGTPERLAVLDE
jgi:MurNAc alpha-1-phosphate uridylyltransferase